jgi:hypothetical protein
VLKDRRSVTVEAGPYNRFGNILDPPIHGRHSAGELGEPYGVDALEAAELEHVLVCQAKPAIQQQNSPVRNLLRPLTFAGPRDTPEAPAVTINSIGLPLQQSIQAGQVLVAKGIHERDLVSMLRVSGER